MCNSNPYSFKEEENSESHQMDSPVSVSSSNDDGNRVKLLCSFLGSIMPRPQDGKLRYVGGETRIISLPRTISYEELMSKMKELYESASVLKYQQPDEDLDALVSVVNDDDVVNMMEEYDKLGSGDGFTRLRIFLFPNQESLHYIEGDDRETERRYVDALNNLNDGRQHVDSSFEDFSVHDAFYEGMMHSQRSNDVSLAQYSLRHVAAPQIYSDSDGQWSPAYYSPRHYGGMLDPRTVSEFPNSPPRYCMQYAEFQDVGSEEFARTHGVHHPAYEQPPPFPDCFPGNVYSNGFEGGNNFEHSRGGLHRNQIYPEQHNAANQFNHHAAFPRDQNEAHVVFNETHPQDRGWVMQHQNSPRAEDSRIHNPFPPRFSEQSMMEGHVVNYSAGHHIPSGFIHHRGRAEMGNEVMHEQGYPPAHHAPFSAHDERSGWFGNYPCCEGFGPVAQPNSHLHPHWKNVPHGIHGNVPNDTSAHPNNARMCSGIDGHHHYGESSRKLHKFEGNSFADGRNGQALSVEQSRFDMENRQIIPFNPVQHFIPADVAVSSNMNCLNNQRSSKENGALKNSVVECKESSRSEGESSNEMKRLEETDGNPDESIDDSLILERAEPSFALSSAVPDLVASIKKATVEEKDAIEQTANSVDKNSTPESEEAVDEHDKVNKIEPTKAEAEAIERGLQTIRNEDLEEIRELGSGTYGAVYHGKWKGSDVAIKRIKASCFSGRPSERDRLIADFWKEALILSSLHHPNVVSFYGIVRDGLNGSLATVTEFMVNGSLKQFLQKKDRTIDRRKRLIIAMDAAFGMEYLHGKNIVHFDLKCENLLVNMRDPHRPICKIGDLGLSKVKQQTLVSGGVRGTLPWMAPELLSGKSHMVSEKIDVYSFGIVMWELLTGDEPYAGMHCASIIGGIVNNTLRPEVPSWCDPEWRTLMEMCWASDPSVRPSFSQVSTALRSMAAAINLK